MIYRVAGTSELSGDTWQMVEMSQAVTLDARENIHFSKARMYAKNLRGDTAEIRDAIRNVTKFPDPDPGNALFADLELGYQGTQTLADASALSVELSSQILDHLPDTGTAKIDGQALKKFLEGYEYGSRVAQWMLKGMLGADQGEVPHDLASEVSDPGWLQQALSTSSDVITVPTRGRFGRGTSPLWSYRLQIPGELTDGEREILGENSLRTPEQAAATGSIAVAALELDQY